MRLVTIAAVSAVSLAALATVPVSAQSPRTAYRNQTESITVTDQYGRRTTRITVRPRTFLDPGFAQARPYEKSYTDYAVPPQTYPGEYFSDQNFRYHHTTSWSRMPFPSCADLPGYCR